MKAKPFIKWAGGKSKLAPEIVKFFPASIRTYYEPFLGGGGVFWEVQDRCETASLSDSNARLIVAYRCVQYYVLDLVRNLKSLARVYTLSADQRETYDRWRCLFNNCSCGLALDNPSGPIRLSALLIALNKTCFNGLYRENKNGGFNVPWGKRKSFVVDEENILACAKALRESLKEVSISNNNYYCATVDARPGDVVYFDPPYVPVSDTANFTGYTRRGFGPSDQMDLARLFAKLAERGVRVVLSNADTPEVRALYGKFEIHDLAVTRSVSAKSSSRVKAREVLVVGGPK